ncbi:MAG: RNA 2',3'-cyclic phosphodiesterase [Candidatus Altiarchaeota archaeon]
MRVFIAIPVPNELKDILLNLQSEFSQIGKFKLVEKENLHLTLKFLGEISDEEKNKVIEALESIKFESFNLSLASIGVFPSESYVRVIWVGISKGDEKIRELQNLVEQILSKLEFKKEKNFHSHITLARVKWIDKIKMREILNKYKGKEFGSFYVESIDIMKSELKQRGPVYSLIRRIPLR